MNALIIFILNLMSAAPADPATKTITLSSDPLVIVVVSLAGLLFAVLALFPALEDITHINGR